MDIQITRIYEKASTADVIRVIASVLHDDQFLPRTTGERLFNFQVRLNDSPLGGVRNNTTGLLTVPVYNVGKSFLAWVCNNPLQITNKVMRFREDNHKPPKHLIATLDKTPFIDPDKDEEHKKKTRALEHKIRVDTVQFGLFFRSEYPKTDSEPAKNRKFSIEWEHHCVAWMKFEYNPKLIRIDGC